MVLAVSVILNEYTEFTVNKTPVIMCCALSQLFHTIKSMQHLLAKIYQVYNVIRSSSYIVISFLLIIQTMYFKMIL